MWIVILIILILALFITYFDGYCAGRADMADEFGEIIDEVFKEYEQGHSAENS